MIIGKTNLSEWANIRSSHSASGWSGRGGLTRNPYALDRNPCGSSSGTGAASRRILRRLASEPRPTGASYVRRRRMGWQGSSRRSGLVSRSGIIPISHSQDAPAHVPHRPRRRFFLARWPASILRRSHLGKRRQVAD